MLNSFHHIIILFNIVSVHEKISHPIRETDLEQHTLAFGHPLF